MKTYSLKKSDIKRSWQLVDVKGEILGRVASSIAMKLTGKDKANYTPHIDSGDYVVVVNAKDVKVTGNKEKNKLYRSHSGYPGGFKETKFAKLRAENPAKIVWFAVRGMLPNNRLLDKRLSRLKIFAGETHPYADKFKVDEKSDQKK